MKYRTTQPFIAFGKMPEVGDVVELTEEQAAVLRDMDSVVPYEVKVQKPVENKAKKQSGSLRPVPPRKKRTRKIFKKSAKKS